MRAFVASLVSLAACGFLAAPRENAAIPPDRFGPYVDHGRVALCQDGVALEPTGPDASGFCVSRDAPAAAACSTDGECAADERCSCGRCVIPYCTGNEECREAETCVLSAARCGMACAVDADCPDGTACDRGRCAQRCSGPEDCLRGESCSRLRSVCVAIACSDDASCSAEETCDAQRARRAFAEPAVVERDGEMLLFAEDVDARAIVRGHGSTLEAFELERTPVVTEASGPAPLLEDGELVLYYARADGSAIVRAAGADGTLDDGEVILVPSHEWEGGVVAAPSAARFSGRTIVAYEAAGGVGLATEVRGRWTRSDSPIVTAATLEDPILWRAVSQVASPMLLSDRTALGDPRLILWVEARGAEGSATVVGDTDVPPPINASIGSAVSLDDGGTFTPSPFNPTFARVAELGRYKAESDPWVLETAGRTVLWYVGSDVETGAAEGLGVAVSGP